jgi:chaperone modulatory protein CbpM
MNESDIIARLQKVSVLELRSWVEWGWIRPACAGGEPDWSEADAARAALIADLRENMGINEEAMPVVLNLIDQVYGLRHELKRVLDAVEDQPEAVRERIRAEIKIGVGEFVIDADCQVAELLAPDLLTPDSPREQ